MLLLEPIHWSRESAGCRTAATPHQQRSSAGRNMHSAGDGLLLLGMCAAVLTSLSLTLNPDKPFITLMGAQLGAATRRTWMR